MRSAIFLTMGILIGSAMHGNTAAQPDRVPMALNHVAIAVPDLDAGIAFYTKAMGLKEAFTFRDDRGTPLSYLQISRDTFLELQPASAERPVGFIHIGIEIADLRRAVDRFRRDGLSVQDPTVSARTKSLISQARGPDGLRMELLEFGPESLQRRVINAWK